MRKKNKNRLLCGKRPFLFSLLVLLLLTACGGDNVPTPEPEVSDEQLPPAAALEAQAWTAEQLDVPVEEVTISSSEQVDWPDACLGLGGAEELCAAVITPGWQIILTVNGEQYVIRTNETGNLIRSPQLPEEADDGS